MYFPIMCLHFLLVFLHFAFIFFTLVFTLVFWHFLSYVFLLFFCHCYSDAYLFDKMLCLHMFKFVQTYTKARTFTPRMALIYICILKK